MKTQFFIGLLALFLLLGTTQAVNIAACSNLDAADTYYLLTANVSNSSFDICMNVTASNVTLDCGNYYIDGLATASTWGVFVNSTLGFTLRNCFVSDWGTDVYVNASNSTNVSYSYLFGSQLWAAQFYNTFNTSIQNNQFGGIRGDTSPYRFNRKTMQFSTVAGDNQDNDKIYIRRNNFLNKTAGLGTGYAIYFDCIADYAVCSSHAHEVIFEYNNFTGLAGAGACPEIYFAANYSNTTIQYNAFSQSAASTAGLVFSPADVGGFNNVVIYNNTFLMPNSYMPIDALNLNASSWNVSNNVFTSFVYYAVFFADWTGDGQQRGFTNSVFENNVLNGGGFYGNFYDTAVRSNNVSNCLVGGVSCFSATGYGITFYNNVVENAMGNTVEITDYGNNLNVSNNVISGAGGSGVRLVLGDNALFYNNVIHDTLSEGIYLDSTLKGSDLTEINVSYNTLHDFVDSCVYGDVQNSFYQNNVCFNSDLEGLWVSALYSTETNNTITYNRVWNGTSGIAGRLDASNVSYNNVSNCTRGITGAGIHVRNGNGIYLGNSVFNNTYGFLVNGSSGIKFYGNNVSYNLINYAFDCSNVFGACGDYSQNNEVVDSVIQSNSSGTLDLSLDYKSQVTLVNTTFNKSAVSFGSGSFFGAPAVSNLTVKWYVYLLVIDNVSDPFGSAYANLSNTANQWLLNQYFNETTNSTGFTPRLNVTEYYQNATAVYNFTPHNASGSWYGLSINYSTGYVTNATTITIVLTPVTTATSTSGNLPTTFNLVTQVILALLLIIVVFLMLSVAFERQELKLLFLLLALTTITVSIYVVSSAAELNSITTTLYNAGWVEQKHEVSNSTYELNEGNQNTFVTLFSGWNWVFYFILALIFINLVKESWEYFKDGKRKKNAVF